MPLAVRGLRELNTALARADRDVRLGIRKELRAVAEPVRSTAELLAPTAVRKIETGDRWSLMRIGITRTSVYVAPRERGVKRGNPAGRPNLAPMLAGGALEPALDRNAARVERELERMLDTVAARFNRRP